VPVLVEQDTRISGKAKETTVAFRISCPRSSWSLAKIRGPNPTYGVEATEFRGNTPNDMLRLIGRSPFVSLCFYFSKLLSSEGNVQVVNGDVTYEGVACAATLEIIGVWLVQLGSRQDPLLDPAADPAHRKPIA
jgi:hypothetical protein